MSKKIKAFKKREDRVRSKIKQTSDRLRLCMTKSSRHICAQIIDDSVGHTLVAVSSLSYRSKKDDKKPNFCNVKTAVLLAKSLSEKAKEKNIKYVVFDKGGNKYHGIVKSFVDTIRNENYIVV